MKLEIKYQRTPENEETHYKEVPDTIDGWVAFVGYEYLLSTILEGMTLKGRKIIKSGKDFDHSARLLAHWIPGMSRKKGRKPTKLEVPAEEMEEFKKWQAERNNQN